MGEQENKGIVSRICDNFKAGRVEDSKNFLSANVVFISPDLIPLVPRDEKRGRDEVIEYLNEVLSENELRDFQVQEFIAQGDKVVALGEYTLLPGGTRELIHFSWGHIYTLENGKVTRIEEYMRRVNLTPLP